MENRKVFYMGHYAEFLLFSNKYKEIIKIENLYYAPNFPNGPIYSDKTIWSSQDKIEEISKNILDSILIIGQGKHFSVMEQGIIDPIVNKLFSISTENIFNEHFEDYFPVKKIIEEKYSRFSLMEIE